jgi:hypothetical protein
LTPSPVITNPSHRAEPTEFYINSDAKG